MKVNGDESLAWGLFVPFAVEAEDEEGHHEHAREGFDRGD